MVSLALFQPEIPSNTGALMRLSACLAVDLHVIGPTSFQMNDKALRRAGMDYRDKAKTHIHTDYEAFSKQLSSAQRLVLLTTKSTTPYTKFQFQTDDVLILGRETSGAPDWLHQRADARLTIPMAPGQRSLNMALSAGLVLGEALRQTDGFASLD